MKLISLVKNLFKRKEMRFLFVGGLNTIIGYGSYSLFLFLGAHYAVANTFSYIIGIIHSYIWNKCFTFKSKQKSVFALKEVLRFISVYLISYVVGQLMLYLLISKFGLNKYAAGLINLIFTTLISWFGHNYFSFQQK